MLDGTPPIRMALVTLSATFSASGTPITYTPPTSIATGSMAVEVVAFAEADQPADDVSPIIITAFDSNFQAGNCDLEAQGVEDAVAYEFAAVITLDGQGNVTGGEQTVNANGSCSRTRSSQATISWAATDGEQLRSMT